MEQRNNPGPVWITKETAKAVAASIARQPLPESPAEDRLIGNAMEAFSDALAACEMKAQHGVRRSETTRCFGGFRCTAEIQYEDGRYCGRYTLSALPLSVEGLRESIATIVAQTTDFDAVVQEPQDGGPSAYWQIVGAWVPSPYFQAPEVVV